MICKCQHLSWMTHTPGIVPAAFCIVHALPDFCLKEMENWLCDQKHGKSTKEVHWQLSAKTANMQSQSLHPAYTLVQSPCVPHTSHVPPSLTPAECAPSSCAPGSLQHHGSGSTCSSNYIDSCGSVELPYQRPLVHTQTTLLRNTYLSPIVEERTELSAPPDILPNPFGDTPQHTTKESTFTNPKAVHTDVISPDPFLHLYCPPSMLALMGGIAATMMVGSPETIITKSAQPPLEPGMPKPFAKSFLPMEPMLVGPGMPKPTIPLDPNQPITGASRPPLLWWHSSLRNGIQSSANETPKVVSWAMDRDWANHLTRFNHIVYAANFAGLSLLSHMCHHVSDVCFR